MDDNLTQFQAVNRFTQEFCFIYDDKALNEDEMTHNARIIFAILQNNGFSRNSVAGIVGNMEAESTVNPGRWQRSQRPDGTIVKGPAMGLVQWDPPIKYTAWSDASGTYGWYDGYGQLDWINTQTDVTGQWTTSTMFNQTWDQFKVSQASPEYLGKAFLMNFEKPLVASKPVQNYRAQLARKWYDRSIANNWQPQLPDIKSDDAVPVWLMSIILRRLK